MNYLLDMPQLATDDVAKCDSSLLTPLTPLNPVANRNISRQQRMLMQLIQQHQAQAGWIVLLAPSPQVIKLLANVEQLPLHKVLVIHKKQLANLTTVIDTALTSGNCKVVINCGQPLTDNIDHECQKLAAQHHAWFYQLDNLCQRLNPH